MNTPLITWACIVALLVIVVVARMAHGGKAGHQQGTHIIEFGSEREEFFVPGDPIPQDIDDYENDYGDDC